MAINEFSVKMNNYEVLWPLGIVGNLEYGMKYTFFSLLDKLEHIFVWIVDSIVNKMSQLKRWPKES